jgi:hypothetical protein
MVKSMSGYVVEPPAELVTVKETVKLPGSAKFLNVFGRVATTPSEKLHEYVNARPRTSTAFDVKTILCPSLALVVLAFAA